MAAVGIRELRQNLSRYVERVKEGESFTVTERGREVARLVPSGPPDSAIARLVTERGATLARGDLLESYSSGRAPVPAGGPASEAVLAALRGERL
ncbi:MAG TPA: type II toxin-antitoxin system prevent-host-death family antitoxin [Solirubrobacteraceae bacterium]|jgi:prevent-host-death family protein|nr:type II toxin-antitoxin system prevent-host-death family antitoxin [Solirubrobacteraceae bacterium]